MEDPVTNQLKSYKRCLSSVENTIYITLTQINYTKLKLKKGIND